MESAGKKVSNVGYSRGKWKRSDLDVSLQLKVLWSSNPVWFCTSTPHVKWSSYNLCDWAKLLCKGLLWCQISPPFNQTDPISSSQRQPQGCYQRSSGITAGLFCHQRDFQVSHVTGWKPVLFPGVPRLYFAWWSGRTKEQVPPLQHITS